MRQLTTGTILYADAVYRYRQTQEELAKLGIEDQDQCKGHRESFYRKKIELDTKKYQ